MFTPGTFHTKELFYQKNLLTRGTLYTKELLHQKSLAPTGFLEEFLSWAACDDTVS